MLISNTVFKCIKRPCNNYITGSVMSFFQQSRNLFVVSLNYECSLSAIDQSIEEHREFLSKQYEKGYFIASGPKKPRTGGVIIARYSNKENLQELLKEDPFWQYGLAHYDIVEFEPTAYSSAFEKVKQLDNECSAYFSSP